MWNCLIESERRAIRRIRRRMAVLRDRGVAAVEFAIILPILTAMFLGVVEVTNAVSVYRKISHAANVIGDLSTQTDDVTGSVDGLFLAADAVLFPYTISPKISLAGVEVDADGNAQVSWTASKNGGAAIDLSKLTEDVLIPGTFMVVTATEHDYAPSFGSNVVPAFTMRIQAYHRPRVGDTVSYDP